jgi:oxygen-independent coproporphyrinogen-3 oxidase
MTAPPLSLYLHFPWCVRKCPYCDFNSFTAEDTLPVARYLAALDADLAHQAPAFADRRIETIFLGGGTPSLFSPQAIADALASARRVLEVARDAEVTLEANPGTIERGRFAEYAAAGITRVSVGAQSFSARHLEVLGRIHGAHDARIAAEELHAAGIDNFNLDLMYALPGQTVEDALDDLRAALALDPAHLSHYQLTLEPGTVFGARPPPAMPDDDTAESMLAAGLELLDAAGFERYEVSAYARPGRRCRHNLNYWTFGDYVGAGAGAHGKRSHLRDGRVVGVTRTSQAREPRRYMHSSVKALASREVDPADLPFEFMLNALRLVEGVDLALFTARTGLEHARVAPVLRDLAGRGLLDVDHDGYRPSARGLQVLNDALLAFLPESRGATAS